MIYFTILIMIISPILSLPFSVIGLFKDKKRKKIYMVMIAFVMGIVSFYFPYHNYFLDINVYENQVSALKTLDFNEFVDFLSTGKEYLTNTIFWILAKLNYFDFWKFIVPFLGYSIIGITLIEFGEKNKFSNTMINISIILMWLMYNKLNMIFGLRNELAFAIFILAVYVDIIKENKSKLLKIILYLLPVTIHQSTLVLVGLRILLPLFTKNNLIGYTVMIIYALSSNLAILFANILAGIPMFGDMLIKLTDYSYGIQDAIGSNILITVKIFAAVCCFIILKKYKKSTIKDSSKMNKKIYNLAELLLLYGICSFNYYHVFDRYTNFSIYLVVMIFALIINYRKTQKNNQILFFIMGIIVVLLGIIQYKDMLGYGFLDNLIGNIYKNIFIILGGN